MNKQIKRITVFNDICGYGKCSLNIAMPVLSAAGIEACPIPSAVFSTHTAIKNYEYLDTTEILDDYIKSWQAQNIHFDALYTGYFTNEKQVYNALQLFAQYKNALKIVDPVMGDNGIAYDVQNENLCKHMKKIISKADIITPNYTEACMLTDYNYSKDPSEKEIDEILDRLIAFGVRNIVITGIIHDNNVINYAYSNSEKFKIVKQHTGDQIHGAGDLFSSCIVAAILNDKNFHESLDFASEFVFNAVKLTTVQSEFKKRGVSFEPLLYKINELLN